LAIDCDREVRVSVCNRMRISCRLRPREKDFGRESSIPATRGNRMLTIDCDRAKGFGRESSIPATRGNRRLTVDCDRAKGFGRELLVPATEAIVS
jgi:hypothetical protein